MPPLPFHLPKRGPAGPWVMLTAYDALMAAQAEAGGADILLVGDSLGGAVLGHAGVSQVTMEDMVHHARAVARGRKMTPVVVDLPDGSYPDPGTASANARRLMEAGGLCVKLEGCLPRIIAHLVREGIPVMAHLGYTPQTGEPRVVGRDRVEAERLLADAEAVQEAGACALVLELVPREVAATVAARLRLPVIGIGSGPDVDGQVLVITDMWGESGRDFKFLRRFGDIGEAKVRAVRDFAAAVRGGSFPADAESFHMAKGGVAAWRAGPDRP